MVAIFQHSTLAVIVATSLSGLSTFALAVYEQPRSQYGASRQAPVFDYRIVNVYPHDPQAFTQGLVYLNGMLFESTGLNGRSSLREVRIETGEVVRRHSIAAEYFAEGLTTWGPYLIQLTWRSNLGFVHDIHSFKTVRTFGYTGQGWGLTNDGERLVMSDGTASLRFIDPTSFRESGKLVVRDGDDSVEYLNELEFVNGQLYANVWRTERIAVIDLQSGRVTAWIDLHGLLPEAHARSADVLNGIAFDAVGKRLFVTGKLWPELYEIEVRADDPLLEAAK